MIVVYCDMDGVLVNFVQGALDFYKSSLAFSDCRWNFPKQMGFRDGNDPAFWEPLGYEFWRDLKWSVEGPSLIKQLESQVGQKNIALLTSPCQTKGCAEGKIEWVKKNLPDYQRQLFLGSAKNLMAAPKKILVDDHDTNLEDFQRFGGRTIQVPRPWNSARHQTDAMGGFSVTLLASELRSVIRTIAA